MRRGAPLTPNPHLLLPVVGAAGLAALSLIATTRTGYLPAVVESSPATPVAATFPVVTVARNGFIIDGKLQKAKGVVYAPFPVGATGAYDFIADPLIRSRDFPLLRRLGPGLILRTVAAITDRTFLDEAGANGFWVIAGYPIDPALDFRDQFVRDALKSNYRTYVRSIRGHPAILAYEIGNEVAFQIDLDSRTIPGHEKEERKRSWFLVLDELAGIVSDEEGPAHRPVTSAFADLFSLGIAGLSDETTLAQLDFLSCNVYRGTTIRKFVDELRRGGGGRVGLSKPILITEMGVDAFNSQIDGENAVTQRDYVASLIQDVLAQPDVMGGIVIEWSDVWWKRGEPDVHNSTAIATGASPDGQRSDEYLGLNRATKGIRGEPDVLTPRLALEAISQVFTADPPWRPAARPEIRVLLPRAGDQVNHTEYVTAEFEGLAPGTTVFVVVRAPTGYIYPQSSPVSLAVGAGPERLMIGGVYFGAGPNQSIGESFELFFATTTSSGQVRDLIAAGNSGGIAPNSWPPTGLSVFSGVTVVKR